ncbi:MAG: hypothetical protein AB1733_02555 [Thermodesulfobacteriota bacterium]
MHVTHLASNGFYSVSVDVAQKRLHLFLAGTWLNANQVPNWLDDVKAGLRMLPAGFTVLTNSTKLNGILRLDLVVEAQRLILEAGPRKAALVYDPKKVVAKSLMDAAAQDSGLAVKPFIDPVEAEKYLAG